MKDSRKTEADESPMAAKIVQIDEGQIRSHVDQVVRGTVEQTLNSEGSKSYHLFINWNAIRLHRIISGTSIVLLYDRRVGPCRSGSSGEDS
jgi:hypothetical protein